MLPEGRPLRNANGKSPGCGERIPHQNSDHQEGTREVGEGGDKHSTLKGSAH